MLLIEDAQVKPVRKEDARTLNAYLDTLQARVYEVHRDLVHEGQALTLQAFNERLGGGRERSRSLVDIFKEHNRQVDYKAKFEESTQTLNSESSGLFSSLEIKVKEKRLIKGKKKSQYAKI